MGTNLSSQINLKTAQKLSIQFRIDFVIECDEEFLDELMLLDMAEKERMGIKRRQEEDVEEGSKYLKS